MTAAPLTRTIRGCAAQSGCGVDLGHPDSPRVPVQAEAGFALPPAGGCRNVGDRDERVGLGRLSVEELDPVALTGRAAAARDEDVAVDHAPGPPLDLRAPPLDGVGDSAGRVHGLDEHEPGLELARLAREVRRDVESVADLQGAGVPGELEHSLDLRDERGVDAACDADGLGLGLRHDECSSVGGIGCEGG